MAACTTTNLAVTTTIPLQEAAKMSVPYFSLNGRISVRVDNRIDSGQIRWQRSPDEERIGLYSPLGSQLAELVSERRTQHVTLRRGKETVDAASVAELTQSLLGVPLDLERMAEWIQGIGLRENETTDITLSNGAIWRVKPERYQMNGNSLYASRVNATSGDIVVRLVIDEWSPK